VNTASELVPPRPRQRNARGQGAKLTEDIVAGALALIERSGSDEAVTLRARSPGGRHLRAVDLPPHFRGPRCHRDGRGPPRFSMSWPGPSSRAPHRPARTRWNALVAGCESLRRLRARPSRPVRRAVLPVARDAAGLLRAGAAGPGRPARSWNSAPRRSPCFVRGIEDCAEAGASASTDVVADSTAVWVAPARRGYRCAPRLPGFPVARTGGPSSGTSCSSLARITGHPDGG